MDATLQADVHFYFPLPDPSEQFKISLAIKLNILNTNATSIFLHMHHLLLCSMIMIVTVIRDATLHADVYFYFP